MSERAWKITATPKVNPATAGRAGSRSWFTQSPQEVEYFRKHGYTVTEFVEAEDQKDDAKRHQLFPTGLFGRLRTRT